MDNWKRKHKSDRCGICGSRDLIPAVDNHGESYLGCPRCAIVDPATVLAGATAKAKARQG